MSKHLLIPILAASVLALSACSSVDPKNVAEVTSGVATYRDDFKKATLFQGPQVWRDHKGFRLRSAQTHSGEVLTRQFVAVITTPGWAFYDTAYDSNGKRLEVVVLDREVGSCSRGGCVNTESVAVNLPPGYLQAHQGTGLHLQISGRRGESTFVVEPQYVQGFLAKAPFAR